MPITTIFKPYVEQEHETDRDETKSRFVYLFTEIFFNLLEDCEGVLALGDVSQKTGGLAVTHLLDSIRQSIRIQVKQGNVENRQQIRITLKSIQLKDTLATLLDNNVMAETRKPESAIAYVKELLSSRENVCIAFQIAARTGQIFDLQNLNNKSSWISKHIINAINQTGELIAGEYMEK